MAMKVNGVDRLLSKFEELERKVQKDMADKALNKAGDIVKGKIIPKAPELTGALKSSIEKSKIKGSGTNRKIEIGNMNADSDVKRYFYYQENGTSLMIGKKFMKQGFQDSVSDANDAIIEVLRSELK